MNPAITGILSSKSLGYEYFTSSLYPIVIDDSLLISSPIADRGLIYTDPNDLLGVNLPAITNGTLIETVVYKTYDNSLYEDTASVNLPSILSGTLLETITYKTYDINYSIDGIIVSNPTITSGTLVEVIEYINYNNGVIEDIYIRHPSIITGTLE